MAKEHLYWHRPYTTVMAGSFAAGDVQWFPEGGLNVSYNCVDRWAYKHPNKVSSRILLMLAVILSIENDLKADIRKYTLFFVLSSFSVS